MKNMVSIIVLLCIMAMTGCRTSRSVQKESLTSENRQQQTELNIYSSLFDSICNTIAVSVDSIVMKHGVNDTVMKSWEPGKHLSSMKVYGVRLNAWHGQKYIQNTVAMNRNIEKENVSSVGYHTREQSKHQIPWYFVPMGILVFVLIVVLGKKVIHHRCVS